MVAGTATSVGKTFVTCALANELRALGQRPSVRKALQSQVPGEPTDAEVLAGASGEDALQVCPPEWSYSLPMAPPMAAALLGRPVPGLAEVVATLSRWAASAPLALLETVGGLRSPLCADGDTVDLVAALGPRLVVLVVDAGLGAINAVRLSLAALPRSGLPVVLTYLNRYDERDGLHQANRAWLEAECAPGSVLAGMPSLAAGVLGVLGGPAPGSARDTGVQDSRASPK